MVEQTCPVYEAQSLPIFKLKKGNETVKINESNQELIHTLIHSKVAEENRWFIDVNNVALVPVDVIFTVSGEWGEQVKTITLHPKSGRVTIDLGIIQKYSTVRAIASVIGVVIISGVRSDEL